MTEKQLLRNQIRIFDKLLKEKKYKYNVSALARDLNISQTALWQWQHGRVLISIDSALKIERYTNNLIKREELRPDIFKRDKK